MRIFSFLISGLLFAGSASAIQQVVDVSLVDELSSVPVMSIDDRLSGLSELPPLILYDRVLPIAGLNSFNSETSVDIDDGPQPQNPLEQQDGSPSSQGNWVQLKTSIPNTANIDSFEQALSELYNASGTQLFMGYKDLRALPAYTSDRSTLGVGVISAEFGSVNYIPGYPQYSGVALQANGTFNAIPGVSAYRDHNILMASALKRSVVGRDIQLQFDNSGLFQHGSRQLVALSVHIDGMPMSNATLIARSRVVRPRTPVSFHFDESGLQTLVFEASFSDGSQQTTYGQFYVKVPELQNSRVANGRSSAPSDSCETVSFEALPTITAEMPFQGYEAGDVAFPGMQKYCIFYRTNAGSVTNIEKPLIIVDGFDPGDKRQIRDSDSDRDPTKHVSMVDFLSYVDASGEIQSMLTEIRAQGFDVIMVNQPVYENTLGNLVDGGADYIERNAFTLVSLINLLNDRLVEAGSDQQMALIGPSMGGQISRYALAYMEANQLDHNVDLWISLDSPHHGANTSIGLQALVTQLAQGDEIPEAKDFVENWLGSPAARQQLIDQYDPDNNNVNYSFLDAQTVEQGFPVTRGTSFFKRYYEALYVNGVEGSDGFPQDVRKIAVVNGSLSGSAEYRSLINSEVSGEFTELDGNIVNIRGFLRFEYDLPIGSIVFRVHVASLEADPMPASTVHDKISRTHIGDENPRRFMTNYNSRGSMDRVPGGWFNAANQLAEASDEAGDPPLSDLEGVILTYLAFLGLPNTLELQTRAVSQADSHIPSFSAIAHKNPNQNWSNPLDRDLICTDETPFDSYFGYQKNTVHTSFDLASRNWLFAELNGNPQESVFPSNPKPPLNGPDEICYGETNNYTFGNCSVFDVLEWRSSSNIQLSNMTPISVSASINGGNREYAWIEADLSNGETVSKQVFLGKPATPASLTGPTTVNTGAQVQYNSGTAPGAKSYTWLLPPPFQVVSTFNYFGDNWQMMSPTHERRSLEAFTGTAENNGEVRVQGVNRCGLGLPRTIQVEHGNGGPGNGGIE